MEIISHLWYNWQSKATDVRFIDVCERMLSAYVAYISRKQLTPFSIRYGPYPLRGTKPTRNYWRAKFIHNNRTNALLLIAKEIIRPTEIIAHHISNLPFPQPKTLFVSFSTVLCVFRRWCVISTIYDTAISSHNPRTHWKFFHSFDE